MSAALYLLLALQIGIAVSLLAWYWARHHHDRAELILKTGIVAGFYWFDFYAGRWDLCGWYLRWQLLLLFGIGLARHIHEARALRWWVPKGAYRNVLFALKLFVIFLAGMIDTLIYKGFRPAEPALELAFPFRSGTYYTAQGGDFPLLNFHNANPPMRYALEFLKLTNLGFSAKKLKPSEISAYKIYADTVLSPCNARVLRVVNNLGNMPLDSLDEDHPAGNYIMLRYKGNVVVLSHLDSASVRVKPGDSVSTGQVLARVGNSGNCTEPTLGIYAVHGPDPDAVEHSEGIPLTFNGAFLVRNERVTVGK